MFRADIAVNKGAACSNCTVYLKHNVSHNSDFISLFFLQFWEEKKSEEQNVNSNLQEIKSLQFWKG